MTAPALNTFGVTAAMVAARVQGVTVTAGSVPSVTSLDDMIEESAALVCGEAENVGLVVAGMTQADNPAVFARLRSMVLNHTIYRLLIARDRGADIAGTYRALYEDALATMRESASRIIGPTDGPSNVRSPAISPDAEAARAERLSRIAGRIVSGGL